MFVATPTTMIVGTMRARLAGVTRMLPYFQKAECREQGADDYRGGDGPLNVHTGDEPNPLFGAFLEASQQAGYPYTKDMNGYQQEGVGEMDMTIRNGKRWSAAQAYLRPVLERPNLTTETGAMTTRILFDGGTAVGVEYVQDGKTVRVAARKEVIVSGGAINSPQLLMLSGTAPPPSWKNTIFPWWRIGLESARICKTTWKYMFSTNRLNRSRSTSTPPSPVRRSRV